MIGLTTPRAVPGTWQHQDGRTEPVVKVFAGRHCIAIPIEDARAVSDALHDAADQYESEQRNKETP